MTTIADIQQELIQVQLSTQDMYIIKGGAVKDDKRRARPGGGTTTVNPSKG
jgi:hypothetical protein